MLKIDGIHARSVEPTPQDRLKPHTVTVHAAVDRARPPDLPLGDAVDRFIRRADAERCMEEVRSDDPAMAARRRRPQADPRCQSSRP
jgi:hypothetical protein